MQSLLLSANVVLPLFLIMLTGFFVKRRGMLDSHAVDVCNRLINYIFMPAMIFRNIYEGNLAAAMNVPLLCFEGIAVTATVVFLLIVVPRFVKDDPSRSVVIQGIFRGNSSVFGISVAALLLDVEDMGQMSMMISLVVFLYNVYAVLILERFRGGTANSGRMVKSILTNPLILSIVFGLICKALPWPLPEFLTTAINSLGSATTPIGFLILGASFTFASVREHRHLLTVCLLGKLVLLPAVWLVVGALLGFKGAQLCALMIIFAAPTALTSFPMAKEMGGNSALAGEIVVFTSAFSMLSTFLWIWLLGGLGLI